MTTAAFDRPVAAASLHADRTAYNAAFYELGLQWYWDIDTFQAMQSTACERERIRHYVEAHHPHLLRAYDMDFLVDAIQSTKARCESIAVTRNAQASSQRDSHASRAYELGA